MNKYIEIAKTKSFLLSVNNKMFAALAKTLENIAYERVGETPPHNDSEIFAELMLLKSERKEKINSVSDDAALIATELFDEWNPDTAYEKGDRFFYNGHLYRCKKANPINPTWTPDVVHEYYEPVAKPTEDGTIENPIMAVEGMQYEEGKYYAEGDKIYLCTRSELLHHLPSALVGHYFEEVGESDG